MVLIYTSQFRNRIGVAKELNRALLENVHFLLSNTQLDKSFWSETLVYVSHLINRFSSSVIGGKTLLKFWLGGAAQDYDLPRIFEFPAYFHIKEGKLNHRVKEFVFLGVKRNLKGYKLWDPKE